MEDLTDEAKDKNVASFPHFLTCLCSKSGVLSVSFYPDFPSAYCTYVTVELSMSRFANSELLGGGVRVKVWIREQ